MSAPDAAAIYGRSQQEAVVLLRVRRPEWSLLLQERPAEAPLHGGFLLPPAAELPPGADALAHARELLPPGNLHLPLFPVGAWDIPPFTPHRRRVHAFLAVDDHAPVGEPPEQVLERWSRGELLTDGPTLLVLRALTQAPRELTGEELARRIAAHLYAAAHEDDRALSWLPSEVRPGVQLLPLHSPTLPPATHTNAWLLGDGEFVVVDPGTPWEEPLTLLHREIARRLLAGASFRGVLLTHHHTDHVSGAAEVAERWGVPVLAHPITAELLRGRVQVDVLLSEGDVLTLAGGAGRAQVWECLHTPGHAPGHLCLFLREGGVLLLGDMVAGWGTILVDPGEGDMAAYLHHLARLASLPATVGLPAHGPALASPSRVLETYIQHRLERERQILSLLARAPHTTRGLVEQMYRDVPPAWHGLAELSVTTHLIKLSREGRVHQGAEGWHQAP